MQAGWWPKDEEPAKGLAAELRASTSVLHRQAERQLNLPDAIVTGNDDRRWLGAVLGFYQPLEAMLAAFPDWEGRGRDVGPIWNECRQRLDDFGRDHPSRRADVVTGAQRAFQSVLNGFASAGSNEFNHEQ